MKFIRSNLLKGYTTATEVKKLDLPVNPLSHLIISIDGYNATDEATLAEILAFLNSATVSRGGSTIFSLQSEDWYMQNAYLFRSNPILTGKLATDNLHRSLGLIIPFGRRTFDPSECFPATKKGELTLTMDVTVPSASLDNSTLYIDAVELPNANPSHYLKSTMKVITAPGATGDNEVELPIGNDILAILLRLTTFPATSSHTFGVDAVSIKVNNDEEGYAYATTMTMLADTMFRLQLQGGTIAAQGTIVPDNALFIDYDPHGDGEFALKTAGASSVKAVLEMGVDEATYMTILERVEVKSM
jgi:hypothetical protein